MASSFMFGFAGRRTLLVDRGACVPQRRYRAWCKSDAAAQLRAPPVLLRRSLLTVGTGRALRRADWPDCLQRVATILRQYAGKRYRWRCA